MRGGGIIRIAEEVPAVERGQDRAVFRLNPPEELGQVLCDDEHRTFSGNGMSRE